ncbi:hypothetical protein RF11_07655 [Thelohanellus kitauei]|uniref:Uncharacterized protein n=1 Tax=Thelohanellus kitauei TaxID=669202 RepID=A0A0C2N0B7_THEKT|nr:hypothetical protein RF11_07655 [Thelohanellus kitauei]
MEDFIDKQITDDSVNNAFITLHSEFNKIGFISQVKDIVSKFIYIYMKDTMIPNTVKPASMRLNYIFGNRPELLSLIFNKSNHGFIKTKILIFKTAFNKIFLNIEYHFY